MEITPIFRSNMSSPEMFLVADNTIRVPFGDMHADYDNVNKAR